MHPKRSTPDPRLNDAEWLRSAYVTRSVQSIADELICTPPTVARRMEQFGIPRRDRTQIAARQSSLSPKYIPRICAECHTPFDAQSSDVRRGLGRWCSRNCAAIARQRRRHRAAEIRFWERVTRTDDPDACWLWTGATNSNGYGHFFVDGKTKPAHIFAWELVNGPMPQGLFGCHSCDTPSCCNPRHVFPGTHQDNMDDAVAKGRMCRGERRPEAKVTEADVREIRRRYAQGGVSQQALGDRYGLTQGTVHHIIHRQTWAHVLDD